VLTDWTKEYELPPSGPLNIIEGLMRSCNPLFWHLGLAMYNRGVFDKVQELARADAVNQAIGQGQILVTPLQMARLMAAIGNGGTALAASVGGTH